MPVFSSMLFTSTARNFDFNVIFCNYMNKMALRALGHAVHVMRDEDAREGRRAGAVQQRRAEDRRLRARAVTGKPAGAPKGERRAPRCNCAGGGGGGSCSSSPVVSLTCRTSCICSIDASDGCSAADARFWIVYRGRFRREHDPHSWGQQLQRSLATRGITADRRARCAARRPA